MPAWLSGGLSRAMKREPCLCVCLESTPNYLVSPSIVVFVVVVLLLDDVLMLMLLLVLMMMMMMMLCMCMRVMVWVRGKRA